MTQPAHQPAHQAVNQAAATVDQLLLEHLEAAGLPKDAYELVLAAVLGEGDPQQARDGTPAPPAGDTRPAEPAGAYLTRIEVRGFRGVGEAATLDLVPGPGLTVVTGRNGSGKSSFAEAVELAFTGDNMRWANHSQQWRDGWRNLHVTGERHIRVGLGLDGHRGGAVVACEWSDDAGLDDRTTYLQPAGQRRRPLTDLGWERPLQLYRPFLSYAELGGLLSGRPSEMYDSLHSVLGLARLSEVEQWLREVRGEHRRTRGQAKEDLPDLRAALEAHPDPRAAEALRLLGRVPDLDALDRLALDSADGDPGLVGTLRALAGLTLPDREQVVAQVEEVRDARQRLAELARTPAAEARGLADLLRHALDYQQHHPDQPCPVCGGRPLGAPWAEEARGQVERLTARAEQVDRAEARLRRTQEALRGLVPFTLPAAEPAAGPDLTEVRAAWRRWDALMRAADPDRSIAEAVPCFDALAAALAPVREAATRALADRQQAWQPVAGLLRTWTETARRSRHAADAYRAAEQALTWLRKVGGEIRNQQLAPLAAEAAGIWAQLRQDSNVELGAVRLTGAANSRRVELDVSVDGEPGAALGVMSQGELHALALSLFLPRATMAASPFRFLVIDDPVQSMDPAKVHGLARVLERVAADRQVIVFTHDDRLPTAIRHLGIQAHLRVVSRREQSRVTVAVDRHGDPAQRYLDDAWAVAKDPAVDPGLRTKVVSVLVRDAIEAACYDRVFRAGIRAGRPIGDLEAALADATSLRQSLALALLGDAAKEAEVNDRLGRLHPRAPQVVRDANGGAHGQPVRGPLTALVGDARDLVDRMAAR